MDVLKGLFNLYNENQKLEYIEYEKNIQAVLLNYFRRISEYEEKYNKDIVDMNREELNDTILSLGMFREVSKSHLISLLRGYTNWAKLNGKTANDSPIHKITAESIDSKDVLVSKMLKNPKQLIEIIEGAMPVEKYEDLINRYCRDALIIWLLYSGFKITDLQMLKKNDIDPANKIITLNGKEHKTFDCVVSLWDEVAKVGYIEKRGTKSNRDTINYELVDSEYLFRPIIGRKAEKELWLKESIFMAVVQKIFTEYYKKTNQFIKVSPGNLRLSGIFFKLYLMEAEGKEITSEVLATFLDIEYSNEQDLSLKTRNFAIDYKDWKIAFDYDA